MRYTQEKLIGISFPRRSTLGFTLIELMVVVAIIGILVAIALPAYNDYVRKGQLQEAFTNLSDYRVKMEQYYQDNKNYGSAATCANTASANSWNGFSPPDRKYFAYACALTNTDQGFTVTATGSGNLTTGYDYTIDEGGNKATTSYAGSASTCTTWQRSSSC